eukprot:m51a1_g3716 hypothetical protein (192) ;mRNA; r:455863-456656
MLLGLDTGAFDICALSRTCKGVHDSALCDRLWKKIAKREQLSRPAHLECLSWYQAVRCLPFVGTWHECWSDVYDIDNVVVGAAVDPAASSPAVPALSVAMGCTGGLPESTWEVSDVSFDGRTLSFSACGGASGWAFTYEARRSPGTAQALRLRVQRTRPNPAEFWGYLLRSGTDEAACELYKSEPICYDTW